MDVIHPTNCLIRKVLRKSFRMFINPEEVTRSQMETLTLLRGASHSPVLQKHHVDYYASIRPDSQTTNQVMKLHCVPSYSSESQRTDGARLMKMYNVNFDPFQMKLTTLDDCQEMLSSDSLIPDADADAAYDGHIQHRLRPCGSCKDLDS